LTIAEKLMRLALPLLMGFVFTLIINDIRAHSAETYHGVVVRVIDGDSFIAHIPGFPPPFTPIEVRINGIDAPESMKSNAKCRKELKLGLMAKAWMKARLESGALVTLTWPGKRDKYGRLLAQVTSRGEDLGVALIGLGHARAYDGGTKQSWCR
jgi:endonuclease YncB( thermonuclease family)